MVLKKAEKSADAVLLFIWLKHILSPIKKSDFTFYSVFKYEITVKNKRKKASIPH